MLIALGIVVMVVSLFLIPLGLPGLWVMVGVLGVAAIYGEVGVPVFLALAALAAGAEVAEFLVVKRFSDRYGGSRGAFWGAIVGGVAGVVVGLPIPVVGSALAGVLGTFIGAAAVAYVQTRRLPEATRVGWGVVLGRVFAAAVKTAVGVAILAVGTGALVMR